MSTKLTFVNEPPAQEREAAFATAVRELIAKSGVQVGEEVSAESIRYTSGGAGRSLQIMRRLSKFRSTEQSHRR